VGMAMEERKGILIVFILLKDVDYQKAYDAGLAVAIKHKGVFNGLNVFTFPNPPRDKQTLNIFADESSVGSIIEDTAKALFLTRTDFLVQAFASTQFVPRPQAQTST
jgi:hypothetical protein